ncbi:hypothetical protein WEU32_11865 [Brevundimonas sp. BH3]|uniref:hypothetical protein n=1 Tax=Brevundimonas sp. BH3 TaxID=3133089 RepID=UPI0032550286
MRLGLILTLSLIGGSYPAVSVAMADMAPSENEKGAPVIPRGGWTYPRQLTPASAWGAPPLPSVPTPPAYLAVPATTAPVVYEDAAVPYEEAAPQPEPTASVARPVYRPAPRPVTRPYVYTPVAPAAVAPYQDPAASEQAPQNPVAPVYRPQSPQAPARPPYVYRPVRPQAAPAPAPASQVKPQVEPQTEPAPIPLEPAIEAPVETYQAPPADSVQVDAPPVIAPTEPEPEPDTAATAEPVPVADTAIPYTPLPPEPAIEAPVKTYQAPPADPVQVDVSPVIAPTEPEPEPDTAATAEPVPVADTAIPYTPLPPEPAIEAPVETYQAPPADPVQVDAPPVIAPTEPEPEPDTAATAEPVPVADTAIPYTPLPPEPAIQAPVDPNAPRRDALIFQLGGSAPVAPASLPDTSVAPVQAPATDNVPAEHDPYAPRRDAPIFRLQNPATAPASDGTAPAQPSADATNPPVPAASAGGARYYSVHRQAGRQPDPPQRPEPVYLDALPIDLTTPVSSDDLAAPPEAPQLVRDAKGRVRTVADPDDLL